MKKKVAKKKVAKKKTPWYMVGFMRHACGDGQEWAKQFESLQEAWEECVDPGWMSWFLDCARADHDTSGLLSAFAERSYPDESQITRADRCQLIRLVFRRAKMDMRGLRRS